MAQLDKQAAVTTQEFLVSTLAQSEALSKLLIDKGIITQAEFMEKLSQERVLYPRMLSPAVQ
ncbi:MAG: hypothetical protein ACM3TN_21380 [Alphaproteobacteria bacterium]